MNTLIIIVFGLSWFVFAYFWYGKIIQNRLIHADNANPTPSNVFNDGQDFVPSKPIILFGHHFSSIAGAGPIVGPIIAFALFGWLPAMLWILIGSVFIGAVHDYTILMLSVRNDGDSLVQISEQYISKRSKAIFGVFVWITLTLIQAVFADLVAKTMFQKPEIVIPTWGLLLVAVIFGWFVFKKGVNVTAATIGALLVVGILMLIGDDYPIQAPELFWLILVFIYSFAASVLPVNMLLQPRDYLSMFILLIGVLLGFTGMVILHPDINAPAFVSFDSTSGPLFPILFITIACGAISGFHAIVSSGTTAKQLNKEADGKKIAFGGMLMEGVLAMLVLLMIASVLIWNKDGTSGIVQGFSFQELMKKGPILVFGNSLAITLEPLGIPFFIGSIFGVLMLKSFILTTLDTSARLNRYIVEETLEVSFGNVFANRYFATGISLVVAFVLCLNDGYNVLWPMFGTSNQLIATLALFVVTAYLFDRKTPQWYTLVPAIIMLVVVETALVYQAVWVFWPKGSWHLSILSIVLAGLGIIVAYEAYTKFRMYVRRHIREYLMNIWRKE